MQIFDPNNVHLGVGLGAEVAVEKGLAALQRQPQVLHVGQVAIVDEVNAQRRIDKKRLRLLRRSAARCGVPHMPDARIACHRV